MILILLAFYTRRRDVLTDDFCRDVENLIFSRSSSGHTLHRRMRAIQSLGILSAKTDFQPPFADLRASMASPTGWSLLIAFPLLLAAIQAACPGPSLSRHRTIGPGWTSRAHLMQGIIMDGTLARNKGNLERILSYFLGRMKAMGCDALFWVGVRVVENCGDPDRTGNGLRERGKG